MTSTPTAPAATPETIGVITRALERAEQPLTVRPLRDQLTGPFKLPEDQLRELLEEQVAQRKMFRFSPYKSKQLRYWAFGPDEYVRRLIKALLNKKPQTRSELFKGLKSPARDLEKAKQNAEIEKLLREGAIRELPAFIGGRTKRLSLRPPAPQEYLQDAVEKIVKKLKPLGVPRERILEAARDYFRRPEAPAGGTGQGEQGAPAKPAPASDLFPVLLERMTQIEPAAPSGALVYIKDLRRLMESFIPDKQAFDQAILNLARQGRVALHRHDFPASLSEQERGHLVRDDRGNFYVGIAVRTRA